MSLVYALPVSRRGALILLLLTLACGAGAFAAWRLRNQAKARELEGAWSGLSACLIGAPLAPGQDLQKRLRAVRQAALRPLGTMPNPAAAWPERCAKSASRLHAAIHALASPHPALLRASPLLYEATLSLERGELGDPQEIWQAATEAGLVAGRVEGAPRAPEPLSRLVEAREPLTSLPRLAPRSRELVLDSRLCRVATDPDGKAELDCAKPLEAAGTMAFAAAKDGRSWLFDGLGASADLGFHARDATRSFVRDEKGRIDDAELIQEKRALLLEHGAPGELSLALLDLEGKPARLRRRERYIGSKLLGDQVVWLEHGDLGEFVFAAQVHTDPLLMEPQRPLLPASSFATCEGPKSAAVLALDRAGGVKGVAVHVDDEWSAEEVRLGPGARLTCLANGAVVTHLSGSGELTEVRCTSGGCVKRALDLGAIPSAQTPFALPVGERTLVIYATAFRDYRARLAPFDELPSTPDRLLADDGALGPPAKTESNGFRARIFHAANDDGALVAVESDRIADGFYLFAFEADGIVRSVGPPATVTSSSGTSR